MNIFKFIFPICLLFNSVFIIAQDNCKVLVTNSDNGTVIVKWYSENIYFDKPVYIYRQESGSNNWSILSQYPISKGKAVPEVIVEKDKVLEVLQNEVLVTNSTDLDGITKLVLMIKSVQYSELSDFLGIQYVDSDVSKGAKYKYVISYSSSSAENPIGTSDWIIVGNYLASDAPVDIKTVQEGNSLHFSWEPDEDLFMGVYIYKAEKGQQFKKITSVPVLAGTDEKGNYNQYFYTDDSLNVGVEYIYKISSIDYFGRESKTSDELLVKIKDMEPPIAPDKVVCTTEGKTVNLYWENDNVPDLAGYKVYRAEISNAEYTCVSPNMINKETQIYTDVVPGIGVYNYRVATIDEDGNESLSEIYPVEIKDIFAPSVPLLLTAVAESGKITLNWQPAPEDDVLGYYIYRSIGKESAFLLLNADPVTVTSFTDILPANAKNNFAYKVASVDLSYNKSAMSEFAISRMPDVLAPERPVVKSVKQEKNSIIVEWFPNNDSDLAGYDVYRFNENEGSETAKKINSKIISGITLYTDQFPNVGAKNCYFIVAADSSGNISEASDVRTCKLLTNIDNEDLIKNLNVKYNKKSKQVELVWEVKDTDSETSYIVYKKSSESENFKPISGKILKQEFKDKVEQAEGTYFYRIAVIFGSEMQYSKTETITIKL